MRSIDSIIEKIKEFRPKESTDMILEAYHMAKNAHSGQTRKSGDPYFSHPLEVAYILASHRMDVETIATGLLHDVVEDTQISLEEIEKKFGNEVMHLVDGVTKISSISFRSKDVRQSESFRKMLLAMAKDIRVIIIKLTDRLHNMRTLDHMKENKQQAIAKETLDIYAPIAHRLGISWMKQELEDLCFRSLHQETYKKLDDQLSEFKKERDIYISKVIKLIQKELGQYKLGHLEVSGRHKHLYSIFRKMEKRNMSFEQITDLIAFRIVVDTIPQCYEALGHIHSLWKPVPGRFKDYIALPKANMYQSLHTTVFGPESTRIEIQIRTHSMHQFAEEGVAAHWIYKTNEKASQKDLTQYSWIKQMLDLQEDLSDSHEFIETVKIDLYSDEVYVFTPQGEVIELPRGSTPLDFAYRIHTEVGNRCKGAKIGGKIVPLKYKLRNGDVVSIITDPNSKPSKDWLKYAITSKAKSKIRSLLKLEERETGRVIGKELLDKEIKKIGQNTDKLLSSGKIKEILPQFHLGEVQELFLRIGYGKIDPKEVVRVLFPKEEPETLTGQIEGFFQKLRPSSSPIQVGGINDVMVRFGKCCDPLPGDPILGFITRGRGITVHRNDCFMILEMDNERKIDVEWTKAGNASRVVRIRIISKDKPGMLAEVSKVITQTGGNISQAKIETTKDETAIILFDVSIQNVSQLQNMKKAIESLKGVICVERAKK
ncbi:MAG: bifunctional (p)ppGpp synthetase/guanosine-3',5'-bis(diphosphate) 3'-pyrophosphohydrolase [Bdellovibrionota bacterium]